MSSDSSARATRPLPLVLATVGMLLLLIGAFILGQRTSGPRTSAPGGEAREPSPGAHEEAGHDEKHGASEAITFTPEALRLAGLKVEPVREQSLAVPLTVTGTVEPNPSGVVKVTPPAAGKAMSIAVSIGQEVRAGQTLAVLASAELAAAQAQYRQTGARIEAARVNLRRQQQLAGLGEFGRHKVEEARDKAVEAQGVLDTAENELAAARTSVVETRSERAALEGEVAGAQAEVTEARTEILEAESGVRALRAALDQAQNQVQVAESRFNRYETLLREQLASRQDWEQARADLRKAHGDVEAARANIAQGEAKVERARGHLRSAEAQVRAAQARLEQAGAKIETAQARQAEVDSRVGTARKRVQIAEQALQREERVLRGGFLASKEVQDAEAALRQVRLEQRAAAEAVRLLGGVPGGGNTVPVVAPLAGRVTERLVTLGEAVTPEKALFTVVNLKRVWVQLAVRQQELPAIRVGQPVSITSDTAPGRVFSGTLSAISDHVDETTRTVRVRAALQNAGAALKPQTFVRGRITTRRTAPVLAVPREAVQTAEGKSVVYVQADTPGEFRAVPVEPGDTVGGMTVIASGLEAGARVVTRGAFTVKAQAQKAELGHDH